MQKVQFKDLGLIRYKEAWDFQEELFKEVIETKVANRNRKDQFGTGGDIQLPVTHYLLFCEHYPVYTLGKSGDEKNLLINAQQLKEKEIDYFKINRGGDITFHGPQQIVGYPILDLDHFFTDIHKYLRLLEEMIILTLGEYGIPSSRLTGATGVWIDADNPEKARKICAMGVRCSRWVTMHGFAFNVNTDLDYFNYIIPCGIDDKAVTSMEKELGHKIDLDEVKGKLKNHFEQLFHAELIQHYEERAAHTEN